MEGKLIKQKLDALGISQRSLAELLGVTPQSVSAILTAKDVRSGTLEKIAEVLHQPMTLFYPCANAEINNVYARGKNVNTGDGTLNAENTGVSDDTVRLLLEQNAKLISIIAEKNK